MQSFCDKMHIHIGKYVLYILKNTYRININKVNSGKTKVNNSLIKFLNLNVIHPNTLFYKTINKDAINKNKKFIMIKNVYIQKRTSKYNSNNNSPIKRQKNKYLEIYEKRKIKNSKKLKKDDSYQNYFTFNLNDFYYKNKNFDNHQSSSSEEINQLNNYRTCYKRDELNNTTKHKKFEK